MNDPIEVAIIAAMPREIAGVVRHGWRSQTLMAGARILKLWRKGSAVAVAVGAGCESAYIGTNVVIEALKPKLITSIGFAGALTRDLGVGAVFAPMQVFEVVSGRSFACAGGAGTLVTYDSVAGAAVKQELASAFRAVAIDMEAAGVARAASEAGLPFAAVKAISDALGDEMEFVAPYVRPEGFQTGRFLGHVVVRPWLWAAFAKLAANSAKAERSLNAAVEQLAANPSQYMNRNLAVEASAQQARK